MSASRIAICTLFEGDYHKGVAALANSLVRSGFNGQFWIGYRGPRPQWAALAEPQQGYSSLTLPNGLVLCFVELDTPAHFSHYKPYWCERVLQELAPDTDAVLYLDPDLFILCQWDFFESWIGDGIACCEDSHLPLNPTHPIARRWERFATGIGLTLYRSAEACLNSGLVGITRANIGFLKTWQTVLAQAHEQFTIRNDLKSGNRTDLFHNVDQDALNVAILATPCPISRMGLDGMGFDRGEWATVHAVGQKPGRRRILRDLIVDGSPPDRTLRLYWKYANGPIYAEPPLRKLAARILTPVAALIGRFYRRG